MIVPFHDIIISRGEHPGIQDVGFDKIVQGIRAAVSAGFDSIQLCSENPQACVDPLQRGDLARILESALDVEIQRIMFQTTFHVPVNKKDIEALGYCGVLFYRIPIFGHMPALHDGCVRRPGALDDIVRGLDAIGQVLITGVAKPPFVILDCIIGSVNREHLRGMVEFAADKRVDAVILEIPDASIPYSEIMTDVEASIDYCLPHNVWVEIRDIPQCLLGDRYVHSRDFYMHHNGSEGKAKPPGCGSCVYDSACRGVSKRYLDVHGAGEFVPKRR